MRQVCLAATIGVKRVTGRARVCASKQKTMKIVVGCYDGSLVGWSSSSDSSHQQQGSEIATKSAVQLEEENSEDDERGEQRKRKRGKVGVEAEESGSETVPRDEIEEMIESLELSFAYKAHKGCIKVIAINGSVRVEEPPGSKQEGQNVQKKSRSEASNGSVPKTKKKKKKPLYMAVGGADELVKVCVSCLCEQFTEVVFLLFRFTPFPRSRKLAR